jgi:hypothetical protein
LETKGVDPERGCGKKQQREQKETNHIREVLVECEFGGIQTGGTNTRSHRSEAGF